MSIAVLEVPAKDAAIVAVVAALTAVVLTVNVAEVLPAAILIVAGTVAEDVLHDNDMASPPAGAGELIVTVPVLDIPPFTEAGLTVSEFRLGVLIVSAAVSEEPLNAALMVATVCEVPATVLAINVPALLPAFTVTEAGTVADFELLDSLTIIPSAPAALLRVTVPVEDAPPANELGLRVNETSGGGATLRFAVFETAPLFAVIVTTFWTVTEVVVTENVAELAPALIVTDLGTAAAALLLDRETTRPPVKASPLRLTVPTEEFPPRSREGLTLTETIDAGLTLKVAVCELPLRRAVIVAVFEALTELVVSVNVLELCPVSTIADEGTWTERLSLVSETAVPPGPAGPLNVTVPVEFTPPPTVVGLKLNNDNTAGVIVRVADFAPLPLPAVMVATDWKFTPVVVIVKVAVVAPAATVTDAGTLALVQRRQRGVHSS